MMRGAKCIQSFPPRSPALCLGDCRGRDEDVVLVVVLVVMGLVGGAGGV